MLQINGQLQHIIKHEKIVKKKQIVPISMLSLIILNAKRLNLFIFGAFSWLGINVVGDLVKLEPAIKFLTVYGSFLLMVIGFGKWTRGVVIWLKKLFKEGEERKQEIRDRNSEEGLS